MSYIAHTPINLLLFFSLHYFWEVFVVLVCKPLHQKLAALKLFIPHNCLQESGEILFTFLDGLLSLFLLFKRQAWYNKIWKFFKQHFPQEIEVLIFSLDVPANRVNCYLEK